MSAELAKEARSAMRRKAERMATGDPHAKVDASSWTPAEDMKNDVKTGLRPISRRQFRAGGKVEGGESKTRADRKPRGDAQMADAFVNRDVRAANEEREGEKHVGGFARGGPPTNSYNEELRSSSGRARISTMDSGKYFVNHNAKEGTKDQSKVFGSIFDARHHARSIDKNYQDVTGKPHSMAYSGYSGADANRENRKSGGRARDGRPGKLAGGSLGSGDGRSESLHPFDEGKVPARPFRVLDNNTRKVVSTHQSLDEARAARKKGPVDSARHIRDANGRSFLKRGGAPHKADGGDAGDTVPTERMAFQSGSSRMSKAAGLASGGRADAHWISSAIKHPGALHRELNVADDKRVPEAKLEKAEHSGNKLVAKRAHLAETLRGLGHEKHDGGRVARKDGGRAGKGKMEVNIVIAPKGQDAAPPMPPPDAAAPPMPPPRPPMAPPMAGAPPPMGGLNGMPPGMPPQMPRKRGGRTMDAGAGSGVGRLEKVGLR